MIDVLLLLKFSSESKNQFLVNFLHSSNSSKINKVLLSIKSTILAGSFSINPKNLSTFNLVLSLSRMKLLSSDKCLSSFIIFWKDPQWEILIAFMVSNVFCVEGSYSLIFSILLSKNSILIGTSLLTANISTISPLLLHWPSVVVIASLM